MLILCPNHHAMFDYGVITIDPTNMKVRHINPNAEENNISLNFSHEVAIENITYHFENIFQKNKF